ncbi:glycosyltransferase family 2 protein [Paenibacillus sp. SAFN-117]|uniref:glycosyltransferase family 2 protein n=1 Tax=Paenibacillus sp. SAFN-117 TaxID=3436860 RepID=UPI003F7E4453
MNMSRLTVPVVLFIFKRPDVTEQVFNAIRSARPTKLFLIADGPRPDQPGEAELCSATRAVVSRVDWPCEVSTLFSPVNLGLNQRITSGLNWVFSQVEEAIILEDDCLPHPTFFPFCQELLNRYRNDERIMMISGNNFQKGRGRLEASYYFSRLFHIWGWATWRRAWNHYDDSLRLWPEISRNGWLQSVTSDPNAIRFFHKMYQDHLDGKHVLSWDYKWNLSCWLQNGLSVMPNANLVTNIGFGRSSTYAHDADSALAHLPLVPMSFPLVHPPFIMADSQADQYTMEQQFYLPEPDSGPAADAGAPPVMESPVTRLAKRQLRQRRRRIRRAGISRRRARRTRSGKGRVRSVRSTRKAGAAAMSGRRRMRRSRRRRAG